MDEENVTLETLGQGAALERFNLALQDVLNNIQDVNTDPKKARTVTLKATIKPSADREVGEIKQTGKEPVGIMWCGAFDNKRKGNESGR